MQSAALGLSFCGVLRDLDPCDARVGCTRALAVASVARIGLFPGGLGRIRRGRRSILIVDRLYYRIIPCLRLLLVCLRCTVLLFLCFLFLYIYAC
jgi:hypothetical protein